MDVRYDQITLRNHFAAWKVSFKPNIDERDSHLSCIYQDYIQAKNSLVKAIENLEYRRVFRSLRTHFETWRARNKTREMNACNIWHMRKTIGDNQCRFVLYKWKLALNTRRVEQQAEDDWVFCIRKELDLCKSCTFVEFCFKLICDFRIAKLSRALSGLKTYFEHRLAKRQLQESANAFRNATTQTRSMQKWRLIFRHKRWVNVWFLPLIPYDASKFV